MVILNARNRQPIKPGGGGEVDSTCVIIMISLFILQFSSFLIILIILNYFFSHTSI